MGLRRGGEAGADAAQDQHRQHQQAAAPKYAFHHLCPPSEALPIWQVRDWYAHQTPEGSMDVTPEMQPTASGSPEAVRFDHALESLGDAPASFGKNDGARPTGAARMRLGRLLPREYGSHVPCSAESRASDACWPTTVRPAPGKHGPIR